MCTASAPQDIEPGNYSGLVFALEERAPTGQVSLLRNLGKRVVIEVVEAPQAPIPVSVAPPVKPQEFNVYLFILLVLILLIIAYLIVRYVKEKRKR